MALRESIEQELAALSAHLNAATARLLELAVEFRRQGGADWDDFGCWLAFRCGITVREARELVRVAEALQELPVTRAAFERGELSLTKLRALTRVANPRTETGLVELAAALTASQLERALRAYRRVSLQQADATHELEYLDYHWQEDGSLVIRARLAAEDGTVFVRALDAARERVRERARAERSGSDRAGSEDGRGANTVSTFAPHRSPRVEAFVELAAAGEMALAHSDDRPPSERPQLLVHVDPGVLTADGPGRCDLEPGPVIAPETARRLCCDADCLTVFERHGLPLSVGRRRRTVPPTLRRLLEARDDGSCRWPGCDRRRHLAAHHRRHWAHGGETSLDNLVLLCFQHHRLVHEGGYTIEDDAGDLRFRNRHGLLCPTSSRPPPGSADTLISQNQQRGLRIDAHTNRNGYGDRMDLDFTVAALQDALDRPV